jgi:hypothetical protein
MTLGPTLLALTCAPIALIALICYCAAPRNDRASQAWRIPSDRVAKRTVRVGIVRRILELTRFLLRAGLRDAAGNRDVSITMPTVVLMLMAPEDAERCQREFGAHLDERIADGEHQEARDDRRRLIRHALMLAVTGRVDRLAKRLRS